MDPIFIGVGLAAGLAFLVSRVAQGSSSESFGHHLVGTPGFRSVGSHRGRVLEQGGVPNWPDRGSNDCWDVYEYSGSAGSFLVAMFADSHGSYPIPGRTNMEYVYPDGVEARVVRATGPSGQKWGDLDLHGPHLYDLFVYHPARHPGVFPAPDGFGAVSGWMGGRGPGAGTGLSAGGGGRHLSNSYDWSGPTSSGGFKRWRNPDEDLVVPGEGGSEDDGWSFGEDGRIEDDETGQVWSERFGWVSPAERDAYGINILGINLPISRSDRLERLEEKISNADLKLADLEEDAKEEGADIEKIAKQIAALQTQRERWEEKKNKIEVRMGEESFGLEPGEDLDLDDEMEDLDDLVEDDLLGV